MPFSGAWADLSERSSVQKLANCEVDRNFENGEGLGNAGPISCPLTCEPSASSIRSRRNEAILPIFIAASCLILVPG